MIDSSFQTKNDPFTFASAPSRPRNSEFPTRNVTIQPPICISTCYGSVIEPGPQYNDDCNMNLPIRPFYHDSSALCVNNSQAYTPTYSHQYHMENSFIDEGCCCCCCKVGPSEHFDAHRSYERSSCCDCSRISCCGCCVIDLDSCIRNICCIACVLYACHLAPIFAGGCHAIVLNIWQPAVKNILFLHRLVISHLSYIFNFQF